MTEIDYKLSLIQEFKDGKAEGIAEGEAEGKAEGIAEGEARGKLEVAKNLLSQGIAYDVICMATGLNKEQLAIL